MVDFGPLHRAAQAELLSGTNECCHLQGVILVIDAADQAQLSDAKGIVQRLQAHTDLEVCPIPWLSMPPLYMCTAAEQREGVCCLLLLGQQAGPTFRRCWSGCTCVRFLEWQKFNMGCHAICVPCCPCGGVLPAIHLFSASIAIALNKYFQSSRHDTILHLPYRTLPCSSSPIRWT